MTIWAYIWIPAIPGLIAAGCVPLWLHRRKTVRYTDSALLVWAFGLVTVGCLILLGAVNAGGGYSERQCRRYGDATEVNTTFIRYSFWTWECYVDTDKGRITLGQYRATELVDRT